MKEVNKEHIKDIDFRTREERGKEAIPEMVEWYKELLDRAGEEPYSDLLQGQISMLSSVLWLLLPKNEYNKLRRKKK
jgi:hypothetical protein